MMEKYRNYIKSSIFSILACYLFINSAHAENDKSIDRIEITFVLDREGLTYDIINDTKNKVWVIANSIIDMKPDGDIRMALVTYQRWDNGYSISSKDMSDDIQGLYAELAKMGESIKPDSFNDALDSTVNGLGWTKGIDTRRMVFHVGDNPINSDDPTELAYPQVLGSSPERRVTLNTVQIGTDPDKADRWKDLARSGGGQYTSITKEGDNAIPSQTPFDEEIVRIQALIDKTIIPYGSSSKVADIQSKLESKAQATERTKVDSARYYAKKKGAKEAITGGGDLVSDIENKIRLLDSINDLDLPDQFRGKTLTEKQQLLTDVVVSRRRLEKEIALLVEKRDQFIASLEIQNNTKSKNDGFASAITRILDDQIK